MLIGLNGFTVLKFTIEDSLYYLYTGYEPVFTHRFFSIKSFLESLVIQAGTVANNVAFQLPFHPRSGN